MINERQKLHEKIKNLSESVWEKPGLGARVQLWLENFEQEPSPERLQALYLLSNFMLFSERQIRELLKSVYRDMFRYPIVQEIRNRNGGTLDSATIEAEFSKELECTRFLGFGGASESGDHVLYPFRQINGLATKYFASPDGILTTTNGVTVLRDPLIRRFIFLDDLCGSGTQAEEYSLDLLAKLRRIDPSLHTAYYVLFGTTTGLDYAKRNSDFSEIQCLYELDESFRCFSTTSRIFRTSTTHLLNGDACSEMARKHGERLSPMHPLGYENCQLLLGFNYNTPDNTLPIIWFEGNTRMPWTPIFKRYIKIQGE